MESNNGLKGKVVLITGPAGNLGSAVVDRFYKNSSSLVLLDYREDRLNNIFPQLGNSPDHLLISAIDLTDYSLVESAVTQAIDHFGRIDILIHTAGGFRMGEKVHEISEEAWDQLMDLNVRTLLNISKAVIPHMISKNAGKIVTIGARPALSGKAKMGSYSVAKTAVLRLTESMSAELKSQGININCILPGTIDTPGNRKAMPDADTSKWVSPDSLAEVIAFLSSEAAKDIHGAAIPVYGA
ncbi:MAG: SDR family oxidoreductase [Anaerolineales bacterium]|nr:SDR family oxidoreductase [Anaerolineales bacterium]